MLPEKAWKTQRIDNSKLIQSISSFDNPLSLSRANKTARYNTLLSIIYDAVTKR